MSRTIAHPRPGRGFAAGIALSLLVGSAALAAAPAHARTPDESAPTGSTAISLSAPVALQDVELPAPGSVNRDGDNVSSNLEKLFSDAPVWKQTRSLARTARAAGYRTENDAVLLDVVLSGYNPKLKAAIENAGGEVQAISKKYLRASVAATDAATIEAIGDLPAVQYVYPQYGYVTHAGSVHSRAVETLNVTPIAGAPYNLTGSGQTVGILSDSFAHTPGVRDGDTSPPECESGTLTGSNPQETGDLPAQVELLADDAGNASCRSSGIDEGAAMAELVHDIAPGAAIAFHTAGDSPVEFAMGIDELCRTGSGGPGADVVVDDIIFLAELMYQPGPIARAAANCVASGVPYFSAAGNGANSALHYNYVDINGSVSDDVVTDDGDGIPPTRLSNDFHNWDRNGSADGSSDEPFLQIVLEPGEGFSAVLQWNQPALSPANSTHGPRVDLNLRVYTVDQNGNLQFQPDLSSLNDQQAATASAGADPIEIVQVVNTTGATGSVYLAVDHWAGSRDYIPQQPGVPLEFRLRFFERGDVLIEYIDLPPRTGASTMYGHTQAPGVISVAAVPWFDVPPYGSVATIRPEPFTALGGAPGWQFAADGTYEVTDTDGPDLAAVDGNNTTFFGRDLPFAGLPGDPDDDPNFFGTSAAAPNAAAVAALLQEYAVGLTPAELEWVLASTAIDVTGGSRAKEGDDLVTGAGLIDAQAALAEFPNADLGPDRTVATNTSITLDGTGSSDNNGIAAFAWSQVSGPNVTLSDANSARASFTTPGTSANLQFKLKVTDADGLSHADTIEIAVRSPAPPVADAGPDQTATTGESVTLDGSGSTDPVGRIVSYQWTQTAGTSVSLSGATNPSPTFTAPSSADTLTFELRVTDGKGQTDTDSVSITVNEPAGSFDGGGGGGGGGGALAWPFLVLAGLLWAVPAVCRRH